MKRTTRLLTLLLGLLMLQACHKTPTSEWNQFFGYTKADVLGHYEANPDNSVYEELPTEGVVVYRTTVIDITEYGEGFVSIHITIPDYLNQTFRGQVALNQDDSNISMGETNGADLLLTVYHDAQQRIRLHGRVRRPKHFTEGVPDDYYIYGFDVIKSEHNEN